MPKAMPVPSHPAGLGSRLRAALSWMLIPGLALGLALGCGGLGSSSTTSAPALSSFLPTANIVLNSVVLTGSGFTNTSAITIGGVPVAAYTVNSDTQITMTVPETAITGALVVTTTGGTVTSGSAFTVIPQITSVYPTSGPVGTMVALTGSGLFGATQVGFNEGPASSSSTFSTTSSPANALNAVVGSLASTGPVTVTVSGTTASGPLFTVTAQ